MLSSCPVGAEETSEKPVLTMVGLHHLANEKARSCDASAPLLIVKYYAKGCRACAAIAPRYRALARDLGPSASCFEMEKRLFRVREPCSRAALTTCRVRAPACAARATASNTPPLSLSLLAADAGSSARRPHAPPSTRTHAAATRLRLVLSAAAATATRRRRKARTRSGSQSCRASTCMRARRSWTVSSAAPARSAACAARSRTTSHGTV